MTIPRTSIMAHICKSCNIQHSLAQSFNSPVSDGYYSTKPRETQYDKRGTTLCTNKSHLCSTRIENSHHSPSPSRLMLMLHPHTISCMYIRLCTRIVSTSTPGRTLT